MAKKKIVIIGGGAAGLMAAERFCDDYEIAIYEKGKTIGRKFLVAGKGGFNLTNKAIGNDLSKQYRANDFFVKALLENDSLQMREWLSSLGISRIKSGPFSTFKVNGILPLA